MIKKGSDINVENFEFIAEGSKDYVTLLLSVLQFSDPWFFSFNSTRILRFIPWFCDANFVVLKSLSD